MTYTTLTEVLLDRAESDSYVSFVNGQAQRQHLSYRDLLQRARNRLGQFQAGGLQPGSQLIIQTGDNASFLEAFWACLLGGIIAVPVAGGNSAEHRFKLFRIAQKLDKPGLYTDSQTLSRLSDFAASNGLQDTFDELNRGGFAADQSAPAGKDSAVHNAEENDTAFIQFSSGSTRTPKGVVLTHKNLLTNLRSIVSGARLSSSDHQFSWMPLTHDMGLIGFHLTPVFMDNSHSLMPTDVFVRRPMAWLSEVQEAGASILCSPNFGFQHLLKSFKPEKQEALDLSCVRFIFNGAEPISVALCHRFMQAMVPFGLGSSVMFPVFGLAEASLAVTFPSPDSAFSTLVVERGKLGVGQDVAIIESRRAQATDALFAQNIRDDQGVEFVSVGSPVDNVEVRITGNNGTPLAENVTGHICIRGDNVTRGYYAEPELNQEIITSDGWLDTGDLGFLHEAELFITGRAKDIIFVNGQNVFPHDLEEIILQAGLVERGKLAISSQQLPESGQEKLLIFVLHRSEPADLIEQARAMTRLLSEAAGVAVAAVVPVPRIPKTTSGKVQRYLLVQSLEQGEFEPLEQQPGVVVSADDSEESATEATTEQTQAASAESLDTAAHLLAICNSQVEDMTIGLEDNLFDLGISSLTLAQIHAAIEDTWPDQVDITDLFDYPTVAELANFLDERNGA